MFDTIIQFKLLFFWSVFISGLYFFQDTFFLNPCCKCFKNLMLSFIDKVTTEEKGLTLFI